MSTPQPPCRNLSLVLNDETLHAYFCLCGCFFNRQDTTLSRATTSATSSRLWLSPTRQTTRPWPRTAVIPRLTASISALALEERRRILRLRPVSCKTRRQVIHIGTLKLNAKDRSWYTRRLSPTFSPKPRAVENESAPFARRMMLTHDNGVR